MEVESILKGYIEGSITGQDNQLKAAIGQLTADRTRELTKSLQTLQQQFPATICDLRETISNNTEKIIISNKLLSKSNDSYARWMKWLTFGLVLTGLAQVIVALLVNKQ